MLKRLSMFSLLLAGVVIGIVLSGRATDRPEVIARTPQCLPDYAREPPGGWLSTAALRADSGQVA